MRSAPLMFVNGVDEILEIPVSIIKPLSDSINRK